MRKLFCWLFGHDLYVVQEFNEIQRRVACSSCGADLAMNDELRVVIEWDSEVEEMYREFGHLIVKPWRRA